MGMGMNYAPKPAHTTPGPWEYDEESGDIIAPKCGYQWAKGCAVIAEVRTLDYGETTPNGKLLAKAPELLDACSMAYRLLLTLDPATSHFRLANQPLYAQLVTVIADATG